MSEYADKHSKAGRKDRVEHVLRVDPKARIDASGYTPPDALDADVKTGERPKPRKYAKGGVVEGHKAHHHAGRKPRETGGAANENSKWNTPETAKRAAELRATYARSKSAYDKMTPEQQRHQTEGYRPKATSHKLVDTRGDWKDGGRAHRDAGGQAAVQQLRPNVPTSGLYGSGFQPTHAGMMSTAAGLKKGGKACHKAKGGEAVGTSEVTGVRVTGGRKARADGGKAQRQNGESRAEYRIDEQERTARKDGGRAKGKTNINIIIGAPKEEPKGPMVPPPPSAIPPGAPLPKPGLPPAAMGAMQPPGMGGPGSGPMPPQMPAGMGPR